MIDINDYVSFKSGSDWSPAIAKAIRDLTASGGGILQLQAGIYEIKSTINIPSNVYIVGVGRKVTTIRLANGVNANMVNLNTSSNCGIRDLTIRGNCFDTTPSIDKDGLVIGRSGISAITNEGSMSNILIQNIEIRDIGGNGFHCYRNTWVYYLSKVVISYCTGYGAWIESTDNMYDTFDITANGKAGLYITGSNNRFSNMKIIFNGRGAVNAGKFYGNGTDLNSAGVYCSNGARNTFINIESQENYGHGWVFDGAKDADIVGCLADKNGYTALAPNGTSITGTPSAVGFYFMNYASRLTGIVKATNFNTNLVSQISGYYIDSTCTNIALDYEEDATQGLGTNLSYSSAAITGDMKAKTHSAIQYEDFLESGISLTNKITSYTSTIFQFSTNMMEAGYTITGNEIYGRTAWSRTSPRMGTRSTVSITKDRIYLVRVKVKPTVNNYFLRLTAMYDEAPWTVVRRVDGRYQSGVYSDISFVFKAGMTSNAFFMAVEDKVGTNNTTQHHFYASEFAIVDITDAVSVDYLPKAIDRVVKKNYFLGSRTFM